MNVQEIFDKVIEAGLYREEGSSWSQGSEFMCRSLELAAEREVISWIAMGHAMQAIKDYIKRIDLPLITCLEFNDLPSTWPDGEAVFKDWANRPELTHDQ